MKTLKDKSIIVTGAGQGIGLEVALYLAECGACVTVNDLNETLTQEAVEKIKMAGGRALAAAGSVADWAFSEQLVQQAVQQFGRLDGLVNNAGLHYSALPWQESEHTLKTLVEVNLLGSMYCGIHALKILIKQKSGSIINLTSGAHMGVAEQSAYAATKGGVSSLTYGWSIDAKPYGVRVNAIAPLAKTRMTDSLLGYSTVPEPAQQHNKPVTKVLPAEKMPPIFAYLLSDDAAHITGQTIRFTGSELSLMTPPKMASPIESRGDWNPAAIQAYVEQTLVERLEPIGLGVITYQSPANK